MCHSGCPARLRRTVVSAMTLVCLLSPPTLGASDEEGVWIDAGTKRGVALAFRENLRLGAREVRATTELPFPAALVFAVVCDLSRYPDFVPGIVEATTLEGTTPADYVIYLRYAPRFVVVAARDVILRVRGGPEPAGTFRCSWWGLPDRLPERHRVVRMPLNSGSWIVAPLGAARAHVEYQIAVKPGGRVPDRLVRWGAVRALPEEMEAVQKRLASIP